MPDFPLQRMRITEDGAVISWPPFALPEKNEMVSPNSPDYVVPEPWILDGTLDALGDPIV